jgi:hypothetical protein
MSNNDTPTINAELEEVLEIRRQYEQRKYGAPASRPEVEIRYFEGHDGNYEEPEGEAQRQRFITDQDLIRRLATGNPLQKAAAQAQLLAVGATKVKMGPREEGYYQCVKGMPIWLFLGTTVNDVRDFFDKLD